MERIRFITTTVDEPGHMATLRVGEHLPDRLGIWMSEHRNDVLSGTALSMSDEEVAQLRDTLTKWLKKRETVPTRQEREEAVLEAHKVACSPFKRALADYKMSEEDYHHSTAIFTEHLVNSMHRIAKDFGDLK